jgi:AraC-like DNA-binding protein
MQPIALTRASILMPIVNYLEYVAAPVDTLLARCGLPRWVITDPEMLIPTSGAPRLLAEAARTQGIANVGAKAGQMASIESLGVFGRLIRGARTLGAAVRTTVEHHPKFSSNGRMWLVDRGEQMELCQAFHRFDEDWTQMSHYILMLMLNVLRLGAGPTWRPSAVQLQTAESAALRDVDAFSTAHVQFGQPSTAIVFPRALLANPVRSPRDLEGQEDLDAWSETAPLDDFVGSMLQVVETLSWRSYPDVRTTAGALGMSVRTMQRRLAAAGCTHEDLIDRLRFITAASLLEETDTKILDIALDLGYSDHAHFTRAFHRWTGCSPQEFRRARSTPLGACPNTRTVDYRPWSAARSRLPATLGPGTAPQRGREVES